MRDGAIVLIGMPGAGKSTVGALLAAHLALPLIDTDRLIEAAAGQSLQDLVDSQGADALKALEERVILALKPGRRVIATGGSVVYSDAAMAHLQTLGTRVYLRLDLARLTERLANLDQRGLVRQSGQTLADLYRERAPLYERYADLRLDCSAFAEDGAAACAAAIDRLL